MNKNDYIRSVDSITAPEDLKKRILNDRQTNEKSRKVSVKKLAALAACLCLVIIAGISIVSGANMGSKGYNAADKAVLIEEESYSQNADFGYTSAESTTADSVSLKNKTENSRKIIKNAELYIQTKDYGKFISALNKKIDAFDGYTDKFSENNYASKSASVVVRIPADSLEKFLSGLEEIGTVQSKQISKSDVTESYIDIESHIKALDTEEQALLKILENCKTVSETIEVQSRLSEVRAESESYKSQIKSLDSQISYSTVTLEITEEERISVNSDSFSAQLKEKFNDSLYNIGNFFESLALNFLGGILYILIIAAVAAVIILIIKKRKRKNNK